MQPTESVKQLNAQITAFLKQIKGFIVDFQSQAAENASKLESGTNSVDKTASTDSKMDRTATVVQLQQQFSQVIAAIAATSLSEAQNAQLRPCQTEAHRRLRLLGVEVMKIRTAKQPETLAATRSQVIGHLEEIQAFVQKMAQVLDS